MRRQNLRGMLVRLLLVLAFVPFILTALDLGPAILPTHPGEAGQVVWALAPFLLAFLGLVVCAWFSLRLWNTVDRRGGSLLLAACACALVWTLTLVAARSR